MCTEQDEAREVAYLGLRAVAAGGSKGGVTSSEARGSAHRSPQGGGAQAHGSHCESVQ